MEIMTTKQASGLWGVTPRRISEMCRGGRIEGADERITTGKWVGYKRRDKEGQQ